MPDLPPIPSPPPGSTQAPTPVAEATAASEVQLDCVGCGSFVAYEPGTTGMVCGHCGRRQPIEGLDDAGELSVRELDLRAALAGLSKAPAGELVPGGHEFRCEECGVLAVVEGWAGHCPYCRSPVVVEVQAAGDGAVPDGVAPDDGAEPDDDALVPGSVLPFAIRREQAEGTFRAWVKGLWFAPGDLTRRVRAPELSGVYMPYWTYDSQTSNRYQGQRGEDYWQTERYTDSDGKRRTRQVRRTRWYPAAGVVSLAFDDVLVYASETLPRPLIETLEPWDLGDLTPYRPEYLSGFVAERHQVGLETGFTLAERRMMPVIRRAVERDIGGDRQRIWSLDVAHDKATFKYCLLPLWLAAFRYRGEVYRFVVNARTGEATGERPYSLPKILFAVLLVVALIVWLAYLNGAFAS